MAAPPAGPHPVRTMPRSRSRSRTAAPPLIGVVTHELREDSAPAWAPAPGRRARDLAPARLSLRLSYTQALQEAGAIAVVLPAHGYVDDTDALLDRLDGILVSGGPDLDPALYGQEPHPLLGPDVDLVADEYEQALLRGAAERDLPLLGICRGLQALNVARGGTLHQHVPHHLQAHYAFSAAHDVEVERGSLLQWLTGRDGLAVNSFHHQAADRIGAGLEVAARAPDGTVEALWDPAASFTLAVQWHAELMTHRDEQAALLHGLVHAASGVQPQLALVA
jgi:putative glutamine amidotransferase